MPRCTPALPPGAVKRVVAVGASEAALAADHGKRQYFEQSPPIPLAPFDQYHPCTQFQQSQNFNKFIISVGGPPSMRMDAQTDVPALKMNISRRFLAQARCQHRHSLCAVVGDTI